MTLVKYQPRKQRAALPTLFDWNRDPFDMFYELDRWLPDRFLFGSEWTPAVDVFERNGDIVVKAELPGIDTKQLDVSITDNVLRLRGERSEEKEAEEKGFYRHERFHGSFERTIPLQTEVDPEKVKATYDKGVLEVVLPKAAESGTRTVEVKVK
ncbi:MAG: Hsp20/alpha crystallin family protein [Candidatus Hydrogenedentes bacterium]|nr:Hsp20/alpha crystallin family protein [Candidatus Hydrogenedentota bacterium]